MGSGKRVRPILCVLVTEAAGAEAREFAVDAGCAVEMIHTASLILDDLPCMDDAGMRRGRPTTHREFGQATSILASVGLLNRAFGVVSEAAGASDSVRNATTALLSKAVGSKGMIAGQEFDLHGQGIDGELSPIEGVNWLKTGVLFVASAHIGALAAQMSPQAISATNDFAKYVGLAFQTADDLIDQLGDVDAIGKDIAQDGDRPTLVSLAGPQAARQSCEEHLVKARDALDASGLEQSGLLALVDTIFGASSTGR